MPAFLIVLLTAVVVFSTPVMTPAAPLKTYVAEFSVVGSPDKEQLSRTLQGLLASRLNPDQTQLVENRAAAELTLAGSYASFGKLFSLDILIRPAASGTVTKVFEQGQGQDDLIPAMGRLAGKIERELARISVPALTTAQHPPVLPPRLLPAEASAVISATNAPAAESYIIKSDNGAATNITSAPLDGVFSSIALGRTLPTGERELFIAGEHSLRYLQSGSKLKQLAEITIPIPARILTIDTADLDHDGTPEIYVTILDRETLSSRVYQPGKSGLELIANNQPWFFRGLGTELKDRKIYAQGMDGTGTYYGDVVELVKSGHRFAAGNSRKLPRHATIHNFTLFRDASGAELAAILDEDGYLVVSTADGNLLWKSSDTYGGSETGFKHRALSRMRSTGDLYRWAFIEQRMTAVPQGKLIVPHNEGGLTIGNNRSYNKHTVHALQWNGALFEELWHTRQTPSYLADYAYDPTTHELFLLEVVQKAGLFSNGKTAISINKVE